MKLNRNFFTHFFSISDYCSISNPEKIDLSNPEHPYVEDKILWDSAKGLYAKHQSLSITFDDKPEYREYFHEGRYYLTDTIKRLKEAEKILEYLVGDDCANSSNSLFYPGMKYNHLTR